MVNGILSRTTKRTSRYIAAFVLMVLLFAPLVQVAAGAISQAYKTDSNNITKGALLSLVSSGSTKVEPANSTTNIAHLVGIAADDPLVQLSEGGEKSAQVVMGGSTEALVSDINGAIKAGDKITASPVSGIGMKASEAVEIVGTAQADLSSVKTVSQTVTDEAGKGRAVKVGLVPVAVNVTYYSAKSSRGALASFVPDFMQAIADGIAGKPVSPLRVLLSFVALVMGFAIAVIMLKTSIRSGAISLGRNPMAQKVLRRALQDVIIASIGVLIITAAIVYGILVV